MTETVIDNRSILREWATAFTELGRYSTKYLLRVLGPVAVGIELLRTFPTTYRPEAVLINLADNAYPRPVDVIDEFLRGRNRVQVTVPFDKHHLVFTSTTQAMREQASLVVSPLPSLTDIVECILRFLREDYMKGLNAFEQHKAIMVLSRLLRDEKRGADYFAEATAGLRQMPEPILDETTNGFDAWLAKLSATSPRQLIDNVRANIERWKMVKLPSCGTLPEML